MNTYLSLLDDASLFSLLLRLHYPDLVNLCKSHNYLYKITCTTWFQKEWKRYNIQTRIGYKDEDKSYKVEIDVDRLGNTHGKVTIYDKNNKMIKQYACVQNVVNGLYIERIANQMGKDACVVDGLAHGLTTQYHSDCTEYISYRGGIRHGITRRYYPDDNVSNLEDYTDGLQHGIQIDWWSHGEIAHISYYKKGKRHGKETWWYSDGKIRRQSYHREGRLISTQEWNMQGQLIKNN
jgi:antitoxin component YwqK of YwqJK toxin-antitoxin module